MFEKMIELQQKRRSKKGGFTLVELIVVLVILAILAALLIPALTGYIDKARDKQIIAETRQAVMAAQTLYDEKYGAGADATTVPKGTKATPVAKADILGTDKIMTETDVLELAELKGRGTIDDITIVDGKIATLSWKSSKNGKTCNYTAATGTYEVPKS